MTEASLLDSPAPASARSKAAVGVSISGVNVSYGKNHVLKDVNLEIEPGEFFAFLGPSGCGKTTLLRLIAGFNTADSGSVRIGGQDVGALPPWKRRRSRVPVLCAVAAHDGAQERGVRP